MSESPATPAGASERLWNVKTAALVLVAVGIALDLASKAYMADWLGLDPDHQVSQRAVTVIPGFFSWSGNWNTGITFGIAQGHTYEILAFTVLACAALLAWLVLSRSHSRLFHVSLALILAGAVGNLYDRWQWHKVRDFVLLYWKDPSVSWPTFNLADSMIVVGVILILWRELFGHRGPAPAPAKGTPS